jgi:DNA primase
MLFNFDRARNAVDKQGFFLMVEGQLDTLRATAAGFAATVAAQGTAITPEQLGLLKRYEPKLKVFLDGDRAGQAAALRMLPMALAAELDITFLPLPTGIDPDLFLLKAGAEGVKSLAELTPAQFAHRAFWPQGTPTPQARTTALKAIFELFAHAPSALTQERCSTN